MKELTSTNLYQQRSQLLKRFAKLKPNMLRGSLIERYKRCGKAGCHCAKERGHGPKFFLSVSFPKIRPIMIYVSLANKKNVEEGLKNYQKAKQILEEISKINQELLRRKESLQEGDGHISC